ncbi:MAG: hypothetical protein CM15mP109_08470 [Candidatus Dadabacteria bacterium]|nr:MAG: hypothetical protein CM15mP109_08470 [Candidatus Dadabacteria bacterium]
MLINLYLPKMWQGQYWGDGREITISGADKFSYNVGGNITDGTKGTDLTFTEFAEVFGVYDILNSSRSQMVNSDMYII